MLNNVLRLFCPSDTRSLRVLIMRGVCYELTDIKVKQLSDLAGLADPTVFAFYKNFRISTADFTSFIELKHRIIACAERCNNGNGG